MCTAWGWNASTLLEAEALYRLLTIALPIAALLAILGVLGGACVRALRTWARAFWPH